MTYEWLFERQYEYTRNLQLLIDSPISFSSNKTYIKSDILQFYTYKDLVKLNLIKNTNYIVICFTYNQWVNTTYSAKNFLS